MGRSGGGRKKKLAARGALALDADVSLLDVNALPRMFWLHTLRLDGNPAITEDAKAGLKKAWQEKTYAS